ncbi:MAG: polysaccharide biosynthesis protein [Moraxellaceae bacterium]|nr:MAG: polysaccharide biosynthesis protein [Moraxellaceae bacterium]
MPANTLIRGTLKSLSRLPRWQKQLIIMSSDLLVMVASLHFFMAARLMSLDYILPLHSQLIIFALTFIFLRLSGLYQEVLHAFNEQSFKTVLLGIILLIIVIFSINSTVLHIPRSVPLPYGFVLFIWILGSRLVARFMLRHRQIILTPTKNILIYGAGAAGNALFNSLKNHPYKRVMGFVDDNPLLIGGRIAGVRIYGSDDLAKLVQRCHIKKVLLAMPSISRSRRREIIETLEPLMLKVQSVPSINELINGELKISDIQEVDIMDLLGRDPVPPIPQFLNANIEQKVVMVTGAGGSIGSELCRQIIKLKPKLLILLELSEYALYAIEQELKATAPDLCIIPSLGSVLHQSKLEQIMLKYQVDTVYHAAAYKHVPLVEVNPFVGLMNNSVGTYRCAQAAQRSGVDTFVLISTDKAVRPTNVMGASKRIAELACQALAAQPDCTTQFSLVRFGNVLGSSGSVVPLFRKQIAEGLPITVTHPDVTRYFMTIPEAAQLVIQAGAMGKGGDVFLLDMGEPVKIVDLAKRMIFLSGLTPREPDADHGDIDIVFSGLRHGEKLYEELLLDDANGERTEHRLIVRAVEKQYELAEIESLLQLITDNAREMQGLDEILTQLEHYVDGYQRSQVLSQPEQYVINPPKST